ncbi:hypothetical protein [Roseospira goensis]|uniref:Uncharacterized protein n=1 Tax=Roseospira goensis TaxID=391922 RepID=A0A7W6S247_9PROT|nr:hypothetical protein [Roseospira goensis]MBB4287336.1 hypothetical protein [Roseospira goensis]
MKTLSKEAFRALLLRVMFAGRHCDAATCPAMRRLRHRIVGIPFGTSNVTVLNRIADACREEHERVGGCVALADLLRRYEALHDQYIGDDRTDGRPDIKRNGAPRAAD